MALLPLPRGGEVLPPLPLDEEFVQELPVGAAPQFTFWRTGDFEAITCGVATPSDFRFQSSCSDASTSASTPPSSGSKLSDGDEAPTDDHPAQQGVTAALVASLKGGLPQEQECGSWRLDGTRGASPRLRSPSEPGREPEESPEACTSAASSTEPSPCRPTVRGGLSKPLQVRACGDELLADGRSSPERMMAIWAVLQPDDKAIADDGDEPSKAQRKPAKSVRRSRPPAPSARGEAVAPPPPGEAPQPSARRRAASQSRGGSADKAAAALEEGSRPRRRTMPADAKAASLPRRRAVSAKAGDGAEGSGTAGATGSGTAAGAAAGAAKRSRRSTSAPAPGAGAGAGGEAAEGAAAEQATARRRGRRAQVVARGRPPEEALTDQNVTAESGVEKPPLQRPVAMRSSDVQGTQLISREKEEVRRRACRERAEEKQAQLKDAFLRGRPVGEEPWRRNGEVTLHVYHLAQVVKFTGLPIYHLAVEVYACEHYFCADGLKWCWPRQYDAKKHKKAIPLGNTNFDVCEVWQLIDELMEDWDGSTYNFLRRNCQTFASVFIPRLVPGAAVPAQYSRFK